MNLENPNDRLHILNELNVHLVSRFGEDDYNIFVFGSFLTPDFVPGKSDLDLAVYCQDSRKSLQIECAIEDFLKKYDFPVQIMRISLQDRFWVFLAPLFCGVEFTEYFPDELRTYALRLMRDYREHSARLEHRRFVMREFSA